MRWRRFWWIADLRAGIFLLFLLVWSFGKINFAPTPDAMLQERWSMASFSDFLTQLAGQRFHETGFFSNYLLSNMTVGYPEFSRGWYFYQVPPVSQNSAVYYTHYGSFDAVVNGIARHLGLTGIYNFYRLIAVFSVVSLGLWYCAARSIFGRAVGLVSLLFAGTAVIYLRFIESNASYSWDLVLAFAAAFFFRWAVVRPRPRRTGAAAFAAAWLLALLQALNSPEWALWLQFFFLGCILAFRGNPLPVAFRWYDASAGRRWRGFKPVWSSHARLWLSMLSAPALAFFLRLAQNAWCLGGIGPMFADLTAAIQRRSIGFGMAVESPVRGMGLTDVIPAINSHLSTTAHLSLVELSLLVLLAAVGFLFLRQDAGFKARYRPQLVVSAALLCGAVSFWMALPQATVTSPDTTLRLILPFAGVLFGVTGMLGYEVLRTRRQYLFRGLFAAAFLVLAFSLLFQRLAATPFDVPRWHVQGPPYTGLQPAGIHAVSQFIREKTAYGDIIITGIDTGQTGHPSYPHPSWEYYSQRRVEVVKSAREAADRIRDFEATRRSLDSSNPASRVNYYLLTAALGYDSLELLGQAAGSVVGRFDFDVWWLRAMSGDDIRGMAASLGNTDGVANQPTSFTLYRIDPARTAEIITSLKPLEKVRPAKTPPPENFRRVPKEILSATVSSQRQSGEGAAAAIDLDPATYWHVSFPPAALQNWLQIDVGRPVRVSHLAVMPRVGLPEHFWEGTAILQGSIDGSTWVTIGALEADRFRDIGTAGREWLYYPVMSERSYRYYRLAITDRLARQFLPFLSLADVAFFRESEPVPTLSPSQQLDETRYRQVPLATALVDASTFNQKDEGPAKLVDGDTATYWHVRYPVEWPEHWFTIGLGSPLRLDAVGVMPRAGFPSHLWNGDTALLSGSDDGRDWTPVARLKLDRASLDGARPQWLYYTVNSAAAYRNYRLFFEADSGFLSAAEVRFYTGK
jgi:hypothetical protein